MLRKAVTQFTPFPWLGVVTLIIFHNVYQVKGVLLINPHCSGTALWPWISYTFLCLRTNGTKKVLYSSNWCILLICSVAYWELDCQQGRFLILNGDQKEEDSLAKGEAVRRCLTHEISQATNMLMYTVLCSWMGFWWLNPWVSEESNFRTHSL